MNINFNSFSNFAISIFEENVRPSLSNLQKKTLIVASIAFGALVAFLTLRHCFKANPLNKELFDDKKKLVDDDTPVKAEPLKEKSFDCKGLFDTFKAVELSHDALIGVAQKHFAAHPNKDAIVERIEKKLQKIDYQSFFEHLLKPEMIFTYNDTLYHQDHLSDQEKEIIRNATAFLMELPTINGLVHE